MTTMLSEEEIRAMKVRDLLDVNPEIQRYLVTRIPDI
jgi:hypothetical protein